MSKESNGRRSAWYSQPGEGPRYEKGDPDVRNGGGEDMGENLDQSAEHGKVECPRCEGEFGNLPLHLPGCDG